MLQTVAAFTAIWYYTSSKNAVATQHLVQEIMPNIEENILTRAKIMAILTSLQLVAGLCLAIPTYVILLRKFNESEQSSGQDKRNKDLSLIATLQEKPFLLIGMFHSLGSLFTNLGFSYGSASVVQIIKLLEPIETLILTVFYARSFSSVTARKTISMIVTITGTSVILSQKKSQSSVNTFSIAFALLSGLSLSFRNVTVKHFQKQNAEKTAFNGICKFIEITTAGAMISCLQLLLS